MLQYVFHLGISRHPRLSIFCGGCGLSRAIHFRKDLCILRKTPSDRIKAMQFCAIFLVGRKFEIAFSSSCPSPVRVTNKNKQQRQAIPLAVI